jgi:signal transduction histidine kinase
MRRLRLRTLLTLLVLVTTLDLAVVLEAAIESLEPTADARRITVSNTAPHGVAVVSGDQTRMQQVIV